MILRVKTMKTPEDSTVVAEDGTVENTAKVAAECIELLDEGFSREDVVKIAEWILYLSTQD
jgi:hypothetical protein